MSIVAWFSCIFFIISFVSGYSMQGEDLESSSVCVCVALLAAPIVMGALMGGILDSVSLRLRYVACHNRFQFLALVTVGALLIGSEYFFRVLAISYGQEFSKISSREFTELLGGALYYGGISGVALISGAAITEFAMEWSRGIESFFRVLPLGSVRLPCILVIMGLALPYIEEFFLEACRSFLMVLQ